MLLTGVLFVWGLVTYIIFTGVDSDILDLPQQNLNLVFNPKVNKEIDTFSIQNTLRDPFLGTLSNGNKGNNKASKKDNIKSTEVQLDIIYKGLVKKQNSSDQIFAVSIKKSEYLLKTGQTIDSIKLVSGSQKSIKIIHNNTYQTIKRQ